ncbi:hypothetical protein CG736_35200 [Kitasatospora sp. CB02891]|nr:hypothetical protein CG736_35200 [Kitasatospora sp. CB02891]
MPECSTSVTPLARRRFPSPSTLAYVVTTGSACSVFAGSADATQPPATRATDSAPSATFLNAFISALLEAGSATRHEEMSPIRARMNRPPAVDHSNGP